MTEAEDRVAFWATPPKRQKTRKENPPSGPKDTKKGFVHTCQSFSGVKSDTLLSVRIGRRVRVKGLTFDCHAPRQCLSTPPPIPCPPTPRFHLPFNMTEYYLHGRATVIFGPWCWVVKPKNAYVTTQVLATCLGVIAPPSPSPCPCGTI